MQYRKDKNGNDLSILGYGCMRFTRKGSGIDIEKTEKELLTAYRAGVNYYDTAYIYPGSEAALGEILERNHIRDKVNIATKLPQYLIGNRPALDRYFGEELNRLRTDHVDYYLMHHLTDVAMWEKLKKVGILDWIREKKETGAIRNIGFSYHGNTENFLRILNDYDWDFCQIQYNYLDEVAQAGRAGLQAAAAKGIPVMIMEPLRGGKLVNMLPDAARKAMADNGRPLRHELDRNGGSQLPHGKRGPERFFVGSGPGNAGEGQTRHPGEGKGRLHRLPLLYAMSQRGGYSGHLPLLERDVHRIQERRAYPVYPDRRSDPGAGLCVPVYPLREM